MGRAYIVALNWQHYSIAVRIYRTDYMPRTEAILFELCNAANAHQQVAKQVLPTYVNDVQRLRGMRDITVYFYGRWYERHDAAEIMETVQRMNALGDAKMVSL